jgi:hypothetical protein
METRTSARIALPAAAFGLLVVLALIGSVVSLGNQLSSAHWILGVIFYLLVLVLAMAGIAYPIACTFSRPVFGLYKLYEGSERSRRKYLHMLGENLQRANVPEEMRKSLPSGAGDVFVAEFVAHYKTSLTPAVDLRIKEAAKTSFTTTAISQTPAFDMISVLVVNLRMVRGIVEDCGYRPSTPALFGLYVRAMKATLIAGGLEEMDFEEIVALIGGNAAITAPSVVLSSAAQGAANAYLTVRVGVITKALLFAEEGPADMRELRRNSYGEALSFLKSCGLLDDLRQAMASAAGAARDAAVAKAVDARDAAVKQMADFRDDTMEKLTGLKDATVERIADFREDVAEKKPHFRMPWKADAPTRSITQPQQSGYTQAFKRDEQ